MSGGGPVGDLEPTEAESRRAARDRALELLYEAEAKGDTVDAVIGGLPVAPDDLAVELARGVDAGRAAIDPVLARLVAPRWSLRRLATVDRAILRMGAYELFEVPERSQALVINEAVVLARRFGSDDSPRFVNGVLSAVAAEARPGGAGARGPVLDDAALDALLAEDDAPVTDEVRVAEGAFDEAAPGGDGPSAAAAAAAADDESDPAHAAGPVDDPPGGTRRS